MATTTRTIDDWVDDLNVRFLINQAVEELKDMNRIFFQCEEASWVWEDCVRQVDKTLPKMNVLALAERMFKRSQMFPDLTRAEFLMAFNKWRKYKSLVPVRGAIMLNQDMTRVVLVQGWKGHRWSFPRGKINQNESDLDCALREAWEETGVDLRKAGLVLSDDQMEACRLEKTIKEKDIDGMPKDQNLTFYIFRGVPEDTKFSPQMQQEIGDVNWWPVADLPQPRNRRAQQANPDAPERVKENQFYNVFHFTPGLRAWIKRQARADAQARGRPVPVALGVTDTEDIDAGDTTTDDAPPAEAESNDANFAALVARLGQSHRPSASLPEVSQANGGQRAGNDDQAAALKQILGVGLTPSSQPAPAGGQIPSILPAHDRPPPPLQLPSQSSQAVSSPHHQVHFFPTPHGSQGHGPSPFSHQGRMDSGPLQSPQMQPGPRASMPSGFAPPSSQPSSQHFPFHGPAISRDRSIDPAIVHPPPGVPEPFGKVHGPTIPRVPRIPSTTLPLTPQALTLHNTLQMKPVPTAGQMGGQEQMMEQYRKEKERRDRQTQQMQPPMSQSGPFPPMTSLPGQGSYGPGMPQIGQDAFHGRPPTSVQSVSSVQAQPSPATQRPSGHVPSLQSLQNGPGYAQSPPQFQSSQQGQLQVVQQPVPKNNQASALLSLFKSGAAPGSPMPAPQKIEPAELSAQPPTPGFNGPNLPHTAESRASVAAPAHHASMSSLGASTEKPTNKPGMVGATVTGPMNAPEFSILKQNSHPVEPAPPAQLKPFAPQRILTRENNRQTASPMDIASQQKKPASPARRPPRKAPTPPKQQQKPFQPQQILRRGQPNPLSVAASSTGTSTAAVSPATVVPAEKASEPFAAQVNKVEKAAVAIGKSVPTPAPAPAPAAAAPKAAPAPAAATTAVYSPPPTQPATLAPKVPALDRRGSQTTDQKNALLSLFGGSSAPKLGLGQTQAKGMASPVQAPRSPLPTSTATYTLPHRDPPTPRTAFSGMMSPVSPLAEGASAHNTPPHLRSRISSVGEGAKPNPFVSGSILGGPGIGNGSGSGNTSGRGFETPVKPAYGGLVDMGGVNLDMHMNGSRSASGSGFGGAGASVSGSVRPTSPENQKFLLGFLSDFANKGGN